MNFLRALRTLLFMLAFYGGTVVAVLIALPVAATGRRPMRNYVIGWTTFHALCARAILGIRTRVEGDVPQGPVLVAAKHQSHYEALDLLRVLGGPGAVMKRQLGDIPLWGWVARRYGGISVDRAAGASALRAMIREADVVKAERRPLLIFPEGTRVRPGEAPALQAGFAGLYRRLDLPVVPVALDSGRLWPRTGLVRRSGVVTMRFGAPLPPGLPRAEIERRVREAINALEAST